MIRGKKMLEKITGNMRDIFNRIWKDIKDFRIPILLLAGYNVVARKIFHAFCPQLIFTGFPCAGCGMTRAIFFILTGRFERGLNLNPAAPLWILFIVWFCWNRYVRGRRKKTTMYWLGAVCAVTLAIYVYRMIYCFPGEPPMVFYKNNIIQRLIERYRSM